MSDPIMVNGNSHSWGSIVCKVAEETIFGFTGITYADKRERTEGYGMGPHQAPTRRSRGKYTADPSKLTGFAGAVQDLRNRLSERSPIKSYGDVEFQVVLTYFETEELPLIVVLEKCVWTGNNASNEEGAELNKEEIEIKPLFIRRNGLTLFDNSRLGL